MIITQKLPNTVAKFYGSQIFLVYNISRMHAAFVMNQRLNKAFKLTQINLNILIK